MRVPALLIADAEVRDEVFDAGVLARLSEVAELVAPPQTAASQAQLGEHRREVEVIFATWGMARIDEEFLAAYPKLRAIFYAAGTVRSFVTDALWARGVRVFTATAVNAEIVAEFTQAQILLSLKRAYHLALGARAARRSVREGIAGAHGRTVGLLGLGHIGRDVARRLGAISARVLAFDPHVDPALLGSNVELAGLDQVFAESDVVSCHLPLLPATTGMLRGAHFRRMRRGATFINTARGGVVAEDEMISVLRERRDLVALLDVTEPEPPPPGSPLFELPNVLLTPHIAGCQGSERRLLGLRAVEGAARFLRGDDVAGEVTAQQAALMA